MFKEHSREDVTLNKKEAKSLLKLYNNYDGQRKVHNWKIKEYIKFINKGSFRKSAITLAHNKETGTTHIVNGQHRLLSLSRTDAKLDAILVTYECENTLELVDLYSTFDTGLARNINDIAAAYAKTYELDWNPKVRTWVVSYGQYSNNRVFSTGRSVKSLSDRASCMKDHIPAGNFIQLISGLFLGVKPNRAFNTVSIASCILHSYEAYGENLAIEFWESVLSIGDVVDGVPLEVNDPRRVFRRTIVEAHSDRTFGWWGNTASSRNRVAMLYQLAFKHFLKGTTITRLVYKTSYVFDWEPRNRWSVYGKK